jgi:hypothetical protein
MPHRSRREISHNNLLKGSPHDHDWLRRVSMNGQTLAMQKALLRKAGAERIHCEKVGGVGGGPERVLDELGKGETLVVCKARSAGAHHVRFVVDHRSQRIADGGLPALFARRLGANRTQQKGGKVELLGVLGLGAPTIRPLALGVGWSVLFGRVATILTAAVGSHRPMLRFLAGIMTARRDWLVTTGCLCLCSGPS